MSAGVWKSFFAGVEERSSRLREDASDESSEARAAHSRCCAAAAASTAYASVRRKTISTPPREMQRSFDQLGAVDFFGWLRFGEELADGGPDVGGGPAGVAVDLRAGAPTVGERDEPALH